MGLSKDSASFVLYYDGGVRGQERQAPTKIWEQKLKFLATEVSELPESLRQKAKDFIGQYSALDTSPVSRVGCDSK